MGNNEYKFAVMPYDPVDKFWYINAIGENVTEADVNLALIQLSDDILERIIFVKVEIKYKEPLDEGDPLAY